MCVSVMGEGELTCRRVDDTDHNKKAAWNNPSHCNDDINAAILHAAHRTNRSTYAIPLAATPSSAKVTYQTFTLTCSVPRPVTYLFRPKVFQPRRASDIHCTKIRLNYYISWSLLWHLDDRGQIPIRGNDGIFSLHYRLCIGPGYRELFLRG
jgi:hypothetical protein